MTDDAPSRTGAYREETLDHYGRYCQNCTWVPETDAESHKLHVHISNPDAPGGPDKMLNRTVLCRDCHLNKHSDSAFSHELVGRLTNALSDALSHKRDGFGSRVSRRVRLDTVFDIDGTPPENFANDADEYILVEGIIEGDHYDQYFVNTTQPYLSMCSCYTHSFGTHRAHNICTHVGAAIVRHAITIVRNRGEEPALEYVREEGLRLNKKAQEYVEKQELIDEGLDALDIETRFSESWAQRAQSQAKKMTKYADEFKCFGSACEGCEITLTSEGFKCTDARNKGWEEKFPCPGKLGAYILHETGGETQKPDIDEGHLFTLTRSRQDIPAEKGQSLISIRVSDADEEVDFRVLETGAEFTLTYDVLADAIIARTLKTTSISDISRNLRFGRVYTTDEGVPLCIGPDVERGDVFEVRSPKVRYFNTGDALSVLSIDEKSHTVMVEPVSTETPFGGTPQEFSFTEFQQQLESRCLKSSYISNHVDIIATEVGSAYGKQKVAFNSPKEAKDAFNSLDWDDTKRSWNDTFEYKWDVDGDAIEQVVKQLSEEGWRVWVPVDVREELGRGE